MDCSTAMQATQAQKDIIPPGGAMLMKLSQESTDRFIFKQNDMQKHHASTYKATHRQTEKMSKWR
eukprot:scaffold94565_cov15-Prasinocladus_malaysianus.AAC.1